ncbi:MFS transporter [Burkholderia guangdongensis]|uniref:MFS transporter n=1 Tax=Burkholderia guangdongensis TaxID=1792500 RepID=UPI001FECE743|nr:MFS transporter [Burkholderia guangdongensis]
MQENTRLTRGMAALFALACGVIVANVYYAQPLLATIAAAFGRPVADLGYLVTLTQLGYAGGFVLIVPLGDVVDRRALVLRLVAANVVALLTIVFSPNYATFAAGCILLGVTSCSTQILIPMAASLAEPASRGRAVGIVMSGLLLGVLLARIVAGYVAYWSSWRTIYALAAVAGIALAAVLAAVLPTQARQAQPAARFRYVELIASLARLMRREPLLALRSVYGALAFACFSVVWTGLTFVLSRPPYAYDDAKIGLFGIVGVLGALAAQSAGRLVDRGHENRATGAFAAAILLSFALLAGGAASLPLLVAGVLLLDVGVQGLHISNQSVIYALDANARSRITTTYLASYFVGGAIGSSAAGAAYAADGWPGVCAAGGALAGAAVLVWLGTQQALRSRMFER